MTHIQIRDENNKKIIRWQSWDYLLDLLDILRQYQEIDIVKARQLGVSWLVAAYGLWLALFNDVTRNLYVSQGETEAWELVSKTRFMWEHLPDYLKKPLDNDTRSWITFKDGYSQIKALPSTDKAGSGYNATFVMRDELYNHPMGEQNFSYIAPSIDAGGQLVNLSAVYGDDMSNHFVVRVEQIYRDSNTIKKVYPSGLELYTNPDYPTRALVFLGWKLRPVRYEGLTLEEFYNTRLKPRYTERELDRQYPSSIDDCLRVAITSNFFDYSALEDMGYDACPPTRQTEVDTYNGLIRIYKPPIRGRKYCVFTDPSDGVEDPFVSGVLDFVTGEVVASATDKVKVDFVAKIHDHLVRAYGDATNSFEYTGSVGGVFAKTLEDLGTPNQAPRRKPDGSIDLGKRGQWVSGDHKKKTFGDLAFAVTKKQIVCHDREFMQQAKLVTRDDKGDPVTERKGQFDWVMMMAGVWQLQKYIPKGIATVTRVQYGGGAYKGVTHAF